MEISTRNSDKKNLRKQAKMIKQRKDDGIIRNRNEKQHWKNLQYNLRK